MDRRSAATCLMHQPQFAASHMPPNGLQIADWGPTTFGTVREAITRQLFPLDGRDICLCVDSSVPEVPVPEVAAGASKRGATVPILRGSAAKKLQMVSISSYSTSWFNCSFHFSIQCLSLPIQEHPEALHLFRQQEITGGVEPISNVRNRCINNIFIAPLITNNTHCLCIYLGLWKRSAKAKCSCGSAGFVVAAAATTASCGFWCRSIIQCSTYNVGGLRICYVFGRRMANATCQCL